MKKVILVLSIALLALYSCSSDNDLDIQEATVSIKFVNNWKDSITITKSSFNALNFTNESGQKLSITGLKYVISDITFINRNGDTIVNDDYHLIDVTNNESLNFELPEKIPVGTYRSLTFRFGLSRAKNVNGAYSDLNAANFNLPIMQGGGYYFMKLDGKYINSINEEAIFNYHTITAINSTDLNNIFKTDTSFEESLGRIDIEGNTTITIKANLAQWFEAPNTWNLNLLNTDLTTNYDAQLKMSKNGRSVFSLAD